MKKNDLEIHQRHFLKSKDRKELIEKLKNKIHEETVEEIKVGDHEELYAVNDVLTFWINDEKIIPLLSYLKEHEDIDWKSVTVDKGAIRFMSKGADVMRPGIIEIDEDIEKEDIVLVKDPIHGKVLSVGEALYDAEVMERM